jgi:hypothetical protein
MADKSKSSAVPGPVKEDKPLAAAFPLNGARQTPRAKQMSFKRAEVVEVQWVHRAEASDTIDDVKQPDYWTNVSMTVTPLSKITVINSAMGWEVHLRILAVNGKLVKVAVLDEIQWDTGVSGADISRLRDQYRCEHRSDGWRVVNTDGLQLISGLGSEAEAKKFVDGLLDSMAA